MTIDSNSVLAKPCTAISAVHIVVNIHALLYTWPQVPLNGSHAGARHPLKHEKWRVDTNDAVHSASAGVNWIAA